MDTGADAVRRDTAGVTTRLITAYVRDRLGEDGVRRLLDMAGETRPLSVLEDESSWSTYEQKIGLFDAAARLLGDPKVAYHIGRSVLHQRVGAPVKLMLRALGSPGMVVRNIARANARFTTSSTMEARSVRRNGATLAYRLHDGYEPHRLDCDYTLGVLPAITELFGMPPATVSHPACQVDGAPECVFELTWRPRSRLPRLRRHDARVALLEDQLRTVVDQSESFHRTAVDLVSADDTAVVLDRIAARAAHAVRAQRYVLAVTSREGDPLSIVHEGMGVDEAASVAARLIDEPHRVVDEGRALVVDVVSARRHYGRLAALYDEAGRFFPDEQRLLAAYARHAAVALDTATALEESREGRDTSEALLELSRSLAGATSVDDVLARLGAAAPRVVGAPRVTVLRWDEAVATLSMVAVVGYPDELTAALATLQVRAADTPELADLLLAREPVRYLIADLENETLRSQLRALGADEVVAVPIMSQGAFIGVIAANRQLDDPRLPMDAQLRARMIGLVDQAGLALERARLLESERATVQRLRDDEARIKHLAFHDSLTGLANGRLFSEHLAAAVARARRHGQKLAVLFCDFDRFKNVNDSFGHVAGDDLLREMGRRLRACVRESDVLARLGGDEFTLLLEDIHATDDAALVAGKIVDAISRPFTIDGLELRLSTSVGVAVFPDDGDTPDALLKNADTAMYAAKSNRGTWLRYQPSMNARTRQLLVLEAGLHGALEDGELELHYQPLVDRSRSIVALEALVRWRHREVGLVPPSEFVPLAEETGLIYRLDAWVVHEACRQAAAWASAMPGLPPLRMSVNLSSRHAQQAGVVPLVASALGSSGLPASQLELEITETAAMDAETVGPVLAALHDLGVALALDDFGTGYAVYRHLRRLPVDRIKLDRSFVAGLPDDRYDRAVVSALVRMAHELDMAVTAEGVELEAQAELLAAEGCDEFQGWLFGSPLPAEETGALLRRLAESTVSAGRTLH